MDNDNRFRVILESILEEGNKASNTIDDVMCKIVEESGEIAGEIVTIKGNKPLKDYDPNIEVKIEIADFSLTIFDYILRMSSDKQETIDFIIDCFGFSNRESYSATTTELLIFAQYYAVLQDYKQMLETCAEIKFRYYSDKNEFLDYLSKKLEKWKSYKKNK